MRRIRGVYMRVILFLTALCIFIGTVFIGDDTIISGLILFICLVVMVITPKRKTS